MDSRRFFRTNKGHDEISNQRKTLQGKMRTVLFLVDPNKGADAIAEQVALIGGPPDALARLLALGYIEESGVVAAAANSPLSIPPAAASGADETSNFRIAKVFMNDTTVDTLGIWAFMFTLRLERCATRADLTELLPEYSKALSKKLYGPAVNALVERARELLGQVRR